METSSQKQDLESPELDLDQRDEDDEDEDEEEVVHAHDLWQIARFLAPFARPHRGALLLLAVVLAIETAINFSFPLATQYLLDEGLGANADEANADEARADALIFSLSFI